MKLLNEYKKLLENYSDKYTKFKSSWFKNNTIGDLEVDSPLKTDVYIFPNENGFCIDLYFKNYLIGQYHSIVNDEGYLFNDVEINEKYQGFGFGKILLMKAYDVGINILGFFTMDYRGLTKQQERVYTSLKNKKIILNDGIDYDLAQEEIERIIKNL
ncbi:MAG: hypothetical protein M0R03_22625 [Novosphingobium sp.]|jgi:hypothetical protein|nr:hypothetical protein [Novosphingobium sp.]